MSKNIVFIGDSHIAFYTQILRPYQDFYDMVWRVDNKKASKAGSFSKNLMGNDVRFIWRFSKTAFSSSLDYLNTMFEIYAWDLENIDYVVFQGGSTDMDGPLRSNGYQNTEECIDRFLLSIVSFSEGKSWQPIIMTSLLHPVYAPRDQADRWNDYLVKRCSELGLEVIDMFSIIDRDFKPESWDRHHLSKIDAAKSLVYILEQLN